jgi:predicted Zn-dependent protease with MMP-like domain
MKIHLNQPPIFSPARHLRSSSNQSFFTPDSSPLSLLDAIRQWEQGEKQEQSRVRWRPERMPLSVGVEDPPTNALLEKKALHQQLRTALRQWELASQGAVTFVFTQKTGASSDIQLRWEQTTTFGRDYEVGHTERKVQGIWIQQVSVTLITQPVIDRYLSPKKQRQRLYSTLLHELGHALGLEHSESERDVMHHRGWRNLYLSDNDVRQIQALYSTTQGFVL